MAMMCLLPHSSEGVEEQTTQIDSRSHSMRRAYHQFLKPSSPCIMQLYIQREEVDRLVRTE